MNNKCLKIRFNKGILFLFVVVCSLWNKKSLAQKHELVTVIGVFSGNETSNTLFKVSSPTIPSLTYIRAQKIEGPQDGFFTQNKDNIRYTAISSISGIPWNLSKIRFSFLQSDKKTRIEPSNLRFIINDIDGPNNEALATNCDAKIQFLGTANPTNLIIENTPPDLNAIGTMDENDGPTSRVMFEFKGVSVVEFDNYANDGYLKDFDMNDDYPISAPIYVKCKEENLEHFKKDSITILATSDFIKTKDLLMINTNPIYFDLDKSFIRPDAAIELEKVVRIMLKYPKIKIDLGSHTDSRAPDAYNWKLSERRAKSSLDWIISRGINSSRITGKGYGETKLVNKCSNGVHCTETEHQLNRRTEFIILNPEVINQ